MPPEPLFGPDFARRLERLKWILRRRLAGGGEGDRPGRRKGGLIEFADHRDYAPGDDVRYVDWNVFLRLEKLTVKEFAKEEDVPLLLLLDVSASMGDADEGKFRFARRLAAALGFVSLASRNPVRVLAFCEGERTHSRPFHGSDGLPGLLRFLEPLSPRGRTGLPAALREARASSPPGTLTVLVSDLLDPGDPIQALAALATRGREVCVLRVVAPTEAAPALGGPVTLVDVETGETLDLDLGEPELERFRAARRAHEETFQRLARAHGIRFVSARSDAPFEDVVLHTLREANWLRLGK